MIETVKVSEKAKVQLITLKRRTGIQNWNVICRWAFCMSLAEKSPPPNEDVVADSSVEMTWKTFSGGKEDLYMGLLLLKAKKDGIQYDEAKINNYFKLHLHRGISYLNGSSTETISKFLSLTLKN
jgi:DNA sulfur modification protein DndE